MSGSAALSAARKRRASSSQMPGAGVMNATSNPGGSYYGGGPQKQSLQGIMNQTPFSGSSPAFTFPKDAPPPNVQINIYENIELIKQQLAERTKIIKSQGSSIPADKLRILQKQNEIQTQILKQKMAIAAQMELIEQQKQEDNRQYIEEQLHNNKSLTSHNEPEFIYEKGIPRKNPNYRKIDEPTLVPIAGSGVDKLSHPAKIQTISESHNRRLSPFISMMTDTGVIPPPVVVLKAHDAKLEEHHYFIQEMMDQLDYLHSELTNNKSSKKEESTTDKKEVANGKDNTEDNEEEEEETELLMDVVMNDLMNSREFVAGIVDKIVNETNLSEVIMKIEPIVKENQELRALIHSQQQMMNEMNMMLFRLLNQQNSPPPPTQLPPSPAAAEPLVYQDDGLNGDGIYQPEITEIVLTPAAEKDNELEELDVESIKIVDNDAPVHEYNEPEEEQPEEEQPEEEQPEEEQPEEEQPEEEQPEEEQPDEEQPEDEALPIGDIDTSDGYSEMPHFPEPISLVVSEL
jgi:hypothetical protein